MLNIRTQLHTIIVLVGPSNCGKTTYSINLQTALSNYLQSNQIKPNVHILSSDEIRRELLGSRDYTKTSMRMLEVSNPAFELLYTKLDILTSFPVNAHFVILDTTGFGADFRTKVLKIAKQNHYHCDVHIFNFDKPDEYFIPGSDNNLVRQHVKKLRDYVLTDIKSEYTNKLFIRKRSFEINLQIVYMSNYVKSHLPKNKSYNVIGDLHECIDELIDLLKKLGYNVDNDIITRTEKTINTDIIFVGDLIDKGNKTVETINFIHKNIQLDSDNNHPVIYCCRGNHELTLYNFLTGKKSPESVPLDHLTNHYQSYLRIALDTDTVSKFYDIYAKMSDCYFYESSELNNSGRSFYVTHTPCNAMYLGKYDSESVQNHRYISHPKNMPIDKFILSYQLPDTASHPFHISGHYAYYHHIDGTNSGNNFIMIDTGAIYGNKLTSVTVGHKIRKPIFTSVDFMNKQQKVNAILNDFAIEKTIIQQKQSHPSVSKAIKSKVNYISGTICPADKDNNTSELESLEAGIKYYADSYKIRGFPSKLILQTKYMGSRCNVYLDAVNIEASYMVSRNGHVISTIDKSIQIQLYAGLLNRLTDFISKYFVKMIIIDCELMPWSAIGEKLIDEKFKTIDAAIKSESDILQAHGFDKAYDKITPTQKDKYHITAADYKSFAENYHKQILLYGSDSEIMLKPFNILKIIMSNGTEIIPGVYGIPNITNDFGTENIFRLISDDEICILDMNLAPDNIISLAREFYQRQITENLSEGIVIKPNFISTLIAPCIKVRNPQYLSIIYGMDYTHKPIYEKLISQKNITKKLKLSIEEYKKGLDLLKIPYDQLTADNNRYVELLNSFYLDSHMQCDPRL